METLSIERDANGPMTGFSGRAFRLSSLIGSYYGTVAREKIPQTFSDDRSDHRIPKGLRYHLTSHSGVKTSTPNWIF